jgi:multiple sugar transport system ATP-binding protein
MVFQNYSLYPHKTVRNNLGFGLRLRHAPRPVIADRVRNVARSLGLESLLDRRPGELSGGERQRVALGRAIARRPRAFLLDEPLSNLDAQMRLQTRSELAHLHRQLAATMLYVTHDQEEAMSLGDRVAVLREGVVQQVAPPLDIESRPANTFVAGFIGSPAMNFFPCRLRIEAGKTSLQCPWFQLSIDNIRAAHDDIGGAHAVSGGTSLTPCAAPNSPLTTHHSPHEILLGVRPYDLHVVDPSHADVVARVEAVERLGHQQVIHAFLAGKTGQTPVRIMAPAEPGFAPGDPVGIRFRRDRLHLFENETGRRLN